MGQPTRDIPSVLKGSTHGPTNHAERATLQERAHWASEQTSESLMSQQENPWTLAREPIDEPAEHHHEHLWPSRQANLLASSKVNRYNEEVTGEPTCIPTWERTDKPTWTLILQEKLLSRRTGNPSTSPRPRSENKHETPLECPWPKWGNKETEQRAMHRQIHGTRWWDSRKTYGQSSSRRADGGISDARMSQREPTWRNLLLNSRWTNIAADEQQKIIEHLHPKDLMGNGYQKRSAASRQP
jgi:hypothetical protein